MPSKEHLIDRFSESQRKFMDAINLLKEIAGNTELVLRNERANLVDFKPIVDEFIRMYHERLALSEQAPDDFIMGFEEQWERVEGHGTMSDMIHIVSWFILRWVAESMPDFAAPAAATSEYLTALERFADGADVDVEQLRASLMESTVNEEA